MVLAVKLISPSGTDFKRLIVCRPCSNNGIETINFLKDKRGAWLCRKPLRYVLYKCTYVPYNGTFGASNQGQTLDVWQGEDSQIHHLIRKIHLLNILSNRKKLNHEKYCWIGISATVPIHTDKKWRYFYPTAIQRSSNAYHVRSDLVHDKILSGVKNYTFLCCWHCDTHDSSHTD